MKCNKFFSLFDYPYGSDPTPMVAMSLESTTISIMLSVPKINKKIETFSKFGSFRMNFSKIINFLFCSSNSVGFETTPDENGVMVLIHF
jgi:hypothetical protein